MRADTIAPPEDSPMTVMRDGSPPKTSALAWTHSTAVTMSLRPTFASARDGSGIIDDGSAWARDSWPRTPRR